jgi:hypothetical protein
MQDFDEMQPGKEEQNAEELEEASDEDSEDSHEEELEVHGGVCCRRASADCMSSKAAMSGLMRVVLSSKSHEQN